MLTREEIEAFRDDAEPAGAGPSAHPQTPMRGSVQMVMLATRLQTALLQRMVAPRR